MMIQSSKPRVQRLFRFTAPLHQRQHFVNAHVDKALRAKLGIKRRAIRLSKGDTVKIMSGSKRGTSGKVTMVDLRKGRIHIAAMVKKNAKGKEFNISISPSNVYITDLNLEDKFRADKLKLQQQKHAEEKKAAAVESKKVTEAPVAMAAPKENK